MNPKLWIAAGALWMALAVIAGAFGAHGLQSRLDQAALALWETAARYAVYAGLALAAIGLASLHARGTGVPGPLALAPWLLALGSLVFSGTVATLALGGPRWLGAITPLGGLGMILGLILFGVGALRL